MYFNGFIGSSTYTAAVALESLNTAGRFDWLPFRDVKIDSEKSILRQEDYLKSLTPNRPQSGIYRMRMKEHCMAPHLDEGDEIDVCTDFQNIKVGEILVFRHYDGRIMAHRVIDILIKEKKRAIITAADDGGLWGYPVFTKDIIGKVVNIYKNEKHY